MLPPSVLVRECAELRRQLGQVLDVIEAHAMPLDADQAAIVLDALDVAADYRRDGAANCPDCAVHPAELCSTCEWRLSSAEAYDHLAARLREGIQ